MKKLVLVLIIFMTVVTLTHAQTAEDLDTFGASFNSLDVDLQVIPENPGAFQEIQLVLDSNVVDLNRQFISWFINGQSKGSGIGMRRLTAQTGAYESQTIIQAAVQLSDGSIVRKSITLTPKNVTVLWEATDSYVPPFYLGKKLPGREATIKMIATGPDNVYVWQRNGTPMSESSGYGKNTFTFRHNRIRGNETISVNGTNITIPITDPKLIVYEQNTFTGIKNPYVQATISMPEQKKTLVAEPYFFSVNNQTIESLALQWTMNSQKVGGSSQKITLENPGSSGVAQINLAVKNPVQSLQEAATNLTVLFNQR